MSTLLGELIAEIENFKKECGLTEGNRHSSLRFDMDAQNYLTFHIEKNLSVLNVITFDNNNPDQFNMLANVGDYILKLRDRLISDNGLDNKHPIYEKLTNAADLVTQIKLELNPVFNVQRSIDKLKIELESLKENLDPQHQRGLNNILQQLKNISQQNNPPEKVLADMMQQVLNAYYNIRTAPSLAFTKMKENPLGQALESFINNQMNTIGKENGIAVPHVQHVIPRGEKAPNIPAPEEKRPTETI